MVIANKIDNPEQLYHRDIELVYDLMSGATTAEIAQVLLDNGAEVVRLDGYAALAGEIIGLIDAQKLVDQIMGRRNINSVSVVAGGVWGHDGDVIVNSIKAPTKIIGIADGNGWLKSILDKSDHDTFNCVRKALR
ncbi:MAG: hypothetical protein RBT37_00490 [Dissulfurispiraceae bacterium]|nr:hypothetical protein [Dissulfurispiraceae bacterium]